LFFGAARRDAVSTASRRAARHRRRYQLAVTSDSDGTIFNVSGQWIPGFAGRGRAGYARAQA